jgi:hypothetical protein
VRFMDRKKWKQGRLIVARPKKSGRSDFAGQVVWTGQVKKLEADGSGSMRDVTRDKFLVRIGKENSLTVVGTTSDAEAALYSLLGRKVDGDLPGPGSSRGAGPRCAFPAQPVALKTATRTAALKCILSTPAGETECSS